MAWNAWDACPDNGSSVITTGTGKVPTPCCKQQDRLAGYWKGVGIESNPQVATALALLFLSKGRRPVLIAKLKHDEDPDWNRHRHDLAHLTQRCRTALATRSDLADDSRRAGVGQGFAGDSRVCTSRAEISCV